MNKERTPNSAVENENGTKESGFVDMDDTATVAIEGEIMEDEEVDATDTPKITSDIEQRLAHAEAEAKQFEEQCRRTLAEFKNYKNRTEKERDEIRKNAGAGIILKLLTIIDTFDRAIQSIPTEVQATPWWKGTAMIEQMFRTFLETEGVTPIEAVGQAFDPNLHDAVVYDDDATGQDLIVVEELQKGYKIHDRVLRPTQVKVGKK